MANQTQNDLKNNFNTYSNFPQNLQSPLQANTQQIVMNMYKLGLCYATYHYHFHYMHITIIILLQTPFYCWTRSIRRGHTFKWYILSVTISKNKKKQGVSHIVTLPFTFKSILRQKKKCGNSKIFHHANI